MGKLKREILAKYEVQIVSHDGWRFRAAEYSHIHVGRRSIARAGSSAIETTKEGGIHEA